MAEEKSPSEKTGRRKFTLDLSFTTIFTAVVLVLAALTGAYLWGVMRGRADVASSEKILPAAPTDRVVVTEPEKPDAILKAQELEFAQVLRGAKPRSNQPPLRPAPMEPKPPALEAPKENELQKKDQQKTEVSEEQNQYSDYVFQLAALKDEQAVDALRQKLEGRGLRTRMERSGKMLLVLVHLRGDASRADEVNRISQEMRLGTPLLRSRKPVNQ